MCELIFKKLIGFGPKLRPIDPILTRHEIGDRVFAEASAVTNEIMAASAASDGVISAVAGCLVIARGAHNYIRARFSVVHCNT